MGDNLYQVTHIDFSELMIEAMGSDLSVSDVPEGEVFRLEDFGEFHVILRNGGGKVVNFGEWLEGHENR